MDDIKLEDDNTIIRQCLKGETERYAVLVDRYKSMVFNVAYRMLGGDEAANDIAQETFISAFGALKKFRFDSKFSSWLFGIALNKCRDFLRARKEDIPVDEVQEVVPSREASPEQAAASRQTGDVIQGALNALPAEYREVIVLKHIEELDYNEIAAIVGMSVGALKVRAHRGRELLRKILEKRGVTV